LIALAWTTAALRSYRGCVRAGYQLLLEHDGSPSGVRLRAVERAFPDAAPLVLGDTDENPRVIDGLRVASSGCMRCEWLLIALGFGLGCTSPAAPPVDAHVVDSPDGAIDYTLTVPAGPFVQVGVSTRHACALRDSGHVYCWGTNGWGELGTGDYVAHGRPTRVEIDRVVDIAVGSAVTCVRRRDGTAWCWGNRLLRPHDDIDGVRRTDWLVPTRWSDHDDFIDIRFRSSFVLCGLRANGDVVCDRYGQSEGDPPQVVTSHGPISSPVCGLTESADVVCGGGPPDDPTFSEAGHAGCALDEAGGVRCWGRDTYGVLGRGDSPVREPGPVPGLPDDVVQVDAGYRHTCARHRSGEMSCWGLSGAYERHPPVVTRARGLDDAIFMRSGGRRTCYLRPGGRAGCVTWSDTGEGPEALDYEASSGLVWIEPGVYVRDEFWDGVSALDLSGTAFVADTDESPRFAPLSGDAVRRLVGDCVVEVERAGVSCWGRRSLADVPRFQTIDGSSYVHCAVLPGGTVRCAGESAHGQLGIGYLPVEAEDPRAPVHGIDDAVDVDVLSRHGCAVHESGRVSCWGTSTSGALGSHEPLALEPIEVPGVVDAVDVTVSYEHSCALRATGEVWCWGLDALTGRDRSTPRETPMAVEFP
jgi:alpha-tubulin suppressor-like RCC1 family protein